MCFYCDLLVSFYVVSPKSETEENGKDQDGEVSNRMGEWAILLQQHAGVPTAERTDKLDCHQSTVTHPPQLNARKYKSCGALNHVEDRVL